ncbi:MAG: adenylate/guanylate cyclase domain-containing protein [Pseudomonadota bacterium]
MRAQPGPAPRRWLPQWRPRNAARLIQRGLVSFRPLADLDHHAATRLYRSERRGLQLAILCRTVGFGVALAFYVLSLTLSGSVPTIEGIALLAALAGLGVVHFIIIGTRLDAPWIKFLTTFVDIAAICALVAFLPLAGSEGGDVPQALAYRNFSVHLLFPFLALSALSFSPRLVLWAGASAVVCWWAAFIVIYFGTVDPISWTSLPQNASREEYLAVVLDPSFIGRGTRMVETLTVAIAAVVLALAVARARSIFVAQVRAEEGREAERNTRERITRQLGRFVPREIADRLVADPSGLRPQVRHGAVLVLDIEDFTGFADGQDPAAVIEALNTFLAECADGVGQAGGVVISFTGDGLLATFNTPLEVDAPEAAALSAARGLLACAADAPFAVRVGVAAGELAAGSVGSVDRQAFTVYGDTVNRAARLEALAKSLSRPILVDAAVAGVEPSAEPLGPYTLRGFAEAVPVFAVPVPG